MREVIAYKTDKSGKLTHVAVWVPATAQEKAAYQQELLEESYWQSLMKARRPKKKMTAKEKAHDRKIAAIAKKEAKKWKGK